MAQLKARWRLAASPRTILAATWLEATPPAAHTPNLGFPHHPATSDKHECTPGAERPGSLKAPARPSSPRHPGGLQRPEQVSEAAARAGERAPGARAAPAPQSSGRLPHAVPPRAADPAPRFCLGVVWALDRPFGACCRRL